jgi:hypothetical protein
MGLLIVRSVIGAGRAQSSLKHAIPITGDSLIGRTFKKQAFIFYILNNDSDLLAVI